MNPAEMRMLNELSKNLARRVIDGGDEKKLVMEAVGGFGAYGGSLGDPKHRVFSRKALSALLEQGYLKLINEFQKEKHYSLSEKGYEKCKELKLGLIAEWDSQTTMTP